MPPESPDWDPGQSGDAVAICFETPDRVRSGEAMEIFFSIENHGSDVMELGVAGTPPEFIIKDQRGQIVSYWSVQHPRAMSQVFLTLGPGERWDFPAGLEQIPGGLWDVPATWRAVDDELEQPLEPGEYTITAQLDFDWAPSVLRGGVFTVETSKPLLIVEAS